MGKALFALGILLWSALAVAGEPAKPPETSPDLRRFDGSVEPYARVKVAIPSAARSVEATPARPPDQAPPTFPELSQTAPVSGSASGNGAVLDGSASPPSADDAKKPEPLILAVVNDKPITDLDVMRELWTRRGRETLDWMIGRSILNQELIKFGLAVSDAEVEERLQKHLDGLRKAFPNLSRPDDLTRAASGMRLDEYRERSVWVELALRKIMRVALEPTDAQLRSYYAERQAEFIQPERVRISQVFIAPQADAKNDGAPGSADWALAEKQILEAHTRLRLGEDFATVARTYGSGGQLSRWVVRGELLRELEEAAFAMRPGSFSGPIKTAMGYHILRTEEKRERKLPAFEEVRSDVLEMYNEKLFLLKAGEFMTSLREKTIKSGGLVISEDPVLFPEPAANEAGK